MVCFAKGQGPFRSLWGWSGIPPDIVQRRVSCVECGRVHWEGTMTPLGFFMKEVYRNSRGSKVGGVMHVSIQWEWAFSLGIVLPPHTLILPLHGQYIELHHHYATKKVFFLRMLHGELSITGCMVWVVNRYRLRLSSFKLIKCLCVMFNSSLIWRNKLLNLRP